MAFSFARIILSDTDIDIYDRGLEYFKKKKVFFKNIGNAGCTAEVQGTQNYEVKLEFHKIVSPKYSCNCPFFQTHSKICKHIIAASIAWDAQRNVPMLEEDLVESACLAPSKITRRDITKAFNNPLEANLEIIRRATDEMGNWSRPHAQLPLRPRVCEKKLENPIQFEKALQEIESWYSRDKYDYYFCAGEMVAGFCEVMRWMKQSWNTFLHEVQMKMLKDLVAFNKQLIYEMIDDSDGIHIFTEAHILDLCDDVEKGLEKNSLGLEELNTIRKEIEEC